MPRLDHSLALAAALLAAACARSRPETRAEAPAAPPANPCAAAKLCDDFEAIAPGQPPGGPWQVSASPGQTVVVDGTRAFGGTRSVRVKHTGKAHDHVYMQLGRPVLPLPSNDLHGRLMLFIAKAPPRLHWDNVRGSGPRPGGEAAQYNLGGMKSKVLVNYEPHDCWRGSQLPFPQGRWICLQWRWNGAPGADGGTRNETRVWIDGKPVDDATVERFGDGCVDKTHSEWIAPRFETLSIGWEQYQPSDPIEMWVDDVAVGEAPIACPSPGG